MKLLAVNHFPVDPPVNGGRLRVYNLAKALSPYVESVTILCLSAFRSEPRKTSISKNVTEIDVPASALKSLLLAPLYLLGLNNVDAFSSFKAPSSFLEGYHDHDVCLLEHPYLSPLVKDFGGRIFYDAVDVDYIASQEYNKGKFMSSLVSGKVKEVERLACEISEKVFATNDHDSSVIRTIYGKEAWTLRTPIDVDGIEPVNRLGEWITFIGSDVMHNREVLPIVLKIAKDLPDLTFYIGGSIARRAKQTSKNLMINKMHTIYWTMSDVYRNTALALSIESSHGTGTPFKTLDYMAHGLPVLMMKTEADRVGYEDENNAFVCGDSWSLRDRIRRLMNNRQKLAEVGMNARRLMEQRHEMQKVGESAAMMMLSRR